LSPGTRTEPAQWLLPGTPRWFTAVPKAAGVSSSSGLPR